MLKLHSRKLGSIAILRLQGRIEIGVTDTLRRAVYSQSDVTTVVLDLAQVCGIDAAGLGTLLELQQWSKTKGFDFRLMNVTWAVREVLEITCLNSVFKRCSEAEVLFIATSGYSVGNFRLAHCA
jgi:anti-anti-sigma factor